MVFSGSMGKTPSKFAPSWPVATRWGQALGQHAKACCGSPCGAPHMISMVRTLCIFLKRET